MERRQDRDLERTERHREHRAARHGRHNHDPNDFFGLEVDKMSPKAQVTAGLAVIAPVVVAATLVLALAPMFWWLVFTFGWVIFPAFGLLVRGIAGLSEGSTKVSGMTSSKERELLTALREHGELTPARAAMETSLTVAEADEMLKGLAEGGHLEVRVRGGGLFYALWEPERAVLGPEERV